MKNFTTFLLLFVTTFLFSQDRIPADIADSQISLNILSPSVSFEKGISDKQTLLFSAGLMGLGMSINDDSKFGIAPEFRATFRNYYPRKKVKKDLNPNSGNYIGLVTGYTLGSIADNLDTGQVFENEEAFFMGPVWGIQRNYKSGIHLGFSIGGGFVTGKNTDFDFTGVGGFELGFVISTKTRN